MPRKADGAWVEYDRNETKIVRVFSSEVAALRSAVSNMTGVLRVEYGETVEEALNRAELEGTREAEPLAPIKQSRKVAKVTATKPTEVRDAE